MQLTPHFSLAEMTASATAKAKGIPNHPDLTVLANLKRLAEELEKIRVLLGNQPLKLHSCYRSPDLNKAVGGAPNSYHMQGCAADFDPPSGLTHDQAQHLIGASTGVDYDLILEESAGDGAHWIHFQIPLPDKKGRRILRDAALDHQGGAITRTTAG